VTSEKENNRDNVTIAKLAISRLYINITRDSAASFGYGFESHTANGIFWLNVIVFFLNTPNKSFKTMCL